MLSAIEDKLIAETQAALTVDGQRQYRQVGSLPGELDAALLKRLIAGSPGAYWAFLGGRTEPTDNGVQLAGSWGLYLLTAHASGEAARRRGDARQIGGYEMVSRLTPHLHELLIPGHGMLTLQRVQNLFNAGLQSQGVSLWGLSFALPMCLAEDRGRKTEDRLNTVSLGLVPEVGIGHEDEYEPVGAVG